MSYFKRMEEKLVECPFDKNHKVRQGGLQYHIVRCMKNHPNHVTCPFNACHRVEKKDYKNHILTCPNRTIGQPDYYRESFETKHGEVPSMPIHVGNSEWNTEDEDWSSEQ